MFLRKSLSFRVTRALIAPLTVWCLGCSGFDPIVDALAGGAGSGIECGVVDRAVDASSPRSVSDSASKSEPTNVSVKAADEPGFDCGCGQACHGASPVEAHGTTHLSAPPQVATVDIAQPPSTVRTPLLPPPQRMA